MIKSVAPRNRTLSLSNREEIEYARKAVKFSLQHHNFSLDNQIIWQDTFYALRYIPDGFADLIIVDPPYNLTKNFGGKVFNERGWISGCQN